jgi:hypothetical protein
MLLTHTRLRRTWVLPVLGCLLVLAAGVAAARPAAAAAADTFQLQSVACSSSTRCAAVGVATQDGQNVGPSQAVTFDPTSTASLVPAPIFDKGTITRLSCPTASRCVAVGYTSHRLGDGSATAVVFDPSSPSTTAELTLGGDHTNAFDVSCPSETECTAVVHVFGPDGPGGGVAHAVTFDPATRAMGAPIALNQPTPYDPSLSCPSTSQCTAAAKSQVTFDPSSGASKSSGLSFAGAARVACPSVTQCTAAWVTPSSGGSDPQRAQELTFDPTTGTANSAGTVNLGSQAMSGLACGAVSQCTVVEGVAASVHPTLQTFDPTSGSARSPVGVVPLVSDITCPSASLCVIVTFDGQVLAYEPSSGAFRTIGTVSPGSGGSAAAVLGPALVPSGAAATIGAILKAGAFPATVSAPGPGTAQVTWYFVPKGAHVASKRKPIIVASGTTTVKRAGHAKLKIRLSSAGRKMLKAAKKSIALTAKGTFTPKSGKRVSSKRTFKLKR